MDEAKAANAQLVAAIFAVCLVVGFLVVVGFCAVPPSTVQDSAAAAAPVKREAPPITMPSEPKKTTTLEPRVVDAINRSCAAIWGTAEGFFGAPCVKKELAAAETLFARIRQAPKGSADRSIASECARLWLPSDSAMGRSWELALDCYLTQVANREARHMR